MSKTITALKEWLKKYEEAPLNKSQAKARQFAREGSTTNAKYKQEQLRFAKSTATKLYQQVPDPSKTFEFTLAFIWPVYEFNAYEIFGRSVEAFDTIRFRYKCHIIFDDKMGAFRVFARTREAIDAVQQCFEVELKAISAHNCRKTVEYLVNLPPPIHMREEVTLLQGPSESDGKPASIRPRLSGKLLDETSRTKWTERASELRHVNHKKIEQGLIRVIPNLQFCKIYS